MPAAIKQAVALVTQGLTGAGSELPGNVKTLKAGDAEITRFSAGTVDADTLSLLAPFRRVRL